MSPSERRSGVAWRLQRTEAKREEDWHTGSECSGGRFGMINNVTAEGDGGGGGGAATEQQHRRGTRGGGSSSERESAR